MSQLQRRQLELPLDNRHANASYLFLGIAHWDDFIRVGFDSPMEIRNGPPPPEYGLSIGASESALANSASFQLSNRPSDASAGDSSITSIPSHGSTQPHSNLPLQHAERALSRPTTSTTNLVPKLSTFMVGVEIRNPISGSGNVAKPTLA